jgi:hypothetical protein
VVNFLSSALDGRPYRGRQCLVQRGHRIDWNRLELTLFSPEISLSSISDIRPPSSSSPKSDKSASEVAFRFPRDEAFWLFNVRSVDGPSGSKSDKLASEVAFCFPLDEASVRLLDVRSVDGPAVAFGEFLFDSCGRGAVFDGFGVASTDTAALLKEEGLVVLSGRTAGNLDILRRSN